MVRVLAGISRRIFHNIVSPDPGWAPVVAKVFDKMSQHRSPVAIEIHPNSRIQILGASETMARCIRVQGFTRVFLMQRMRHLRLTWPATTVQGEHSLMSALLQSHASYRIKTPETVEGDILEVGVVDAARSLQLGTVIEEFDLV